MKTYLIFIAAVLLTIYTVCLVTFLIEYVIDSLVLYKAHKEVEKSIKQAREKRK